MESPFEPDRNNFRHEISKMMYGFGDSANPNPDAVLHIERVVLKQLRSLLKEAHQISIQRGKGVISNYELIYLIHKYQNVLKLKRLHDFQVKQEKLDEIAQYSMIKELVGEDPDRSTLVRRQKLSRQKHLKIIKALNGTVEKVNHDYLGYLRKLRAKRVSDALPAELYEPYQQARCITFRTSKAYNNDGVSKLKQWIDPNKAYKITYSGLDILGFIAYEAVADIIEAILLIRQSKLIGLHKGFSSLQLVNGVSTQVAINVGEINEALTKYFTPKFWLNSLFFKNMGLDYLTSSV